MKKIIFITVIFFLIFQFDAYAQRRTPVANKRQITQHARINQGQRSGELSQKESVQLKAQQGRIRRTKRRARADGNVTREERVQVKRKQNRANRNIRRKKNNNKL